MVSSDLLKGWRPRLRALPVFDTEPPMFDASSAPDDPVELIAEWLELALASGVPQPHAVTLVTATPDGAPSSRTVILKDLTAEGLWVATPSDSPAGRDLAEPARGPAVLLAAARQADPHRRIGSARLGGGVPRRLGGTLGTRPCGVRSRHLDGLPAATDPDRVPLGGSDPLAHPASVHKARRRVVEP